MLLETVLRRLDTSYTTDRSAERKIDNSDHPTARQLFQGPEGWPKTWNAILYQGCHLEN